MMGGTGATRGHSTMLDMDTGEPVRMVIELYCGSCAFVRYMHSQLESDTHQDSEEVWYMCVDCLSQKEIQQKYARWDLAGFLRKERVVYLRRDLRNITPARLQLWCQAATRRERILFTAVQASFDCTTLSRAGACNSQEVRTSGGGAVSLPAQYDSRHLRALCHTLRFLAKVAPRALLSVENPWAGYFKEHRLIQEMRNGLNVRLVGSTGGGASAQAEHSVALRCVHMPQPFLVSDVSVFGAIAFLAVDRPERGVRLGGIWSKRSARTCWARVKIWRFGGPSSDPFRCTRLSGAFVRALFRRP